MWVVPGVVQAWSKGFVEHSNKKWYFIIGYQKQKFLYHSDIYSYIWEGKKTHNQQIFDGETTYLWDNSVVSKLR